MRARYFFAVAGMVFLLVFGGCGKASEYFAMGQEAFLKSDFENALLYYSKALEENPEKAEYYIEQ